MIWAVGIWLVSMAFGWALVIQSDREMARQERAFGSRADQDVEPE